MEKITHKERKIVTNDGIRTYTLDHIVYDKSLFDKIHNIRVFADQNNFCDCWLNYADGHIVINTLGEPYLYNALIRYFENSNAVYNHATMCEINKLCHKHIYDI